MLSLTDLKNILGRKVKDLSNVEKQIMESDAGYDGVIALIQTKNVETAVILEHNDVGEFSIRPGGLEKASQSIWVMKMVGDKKDRGTAQRECKQLMKKIISLFVKHEKDDCLKGWEWGSIPYGIRNAGANYTGYEFTLRFTEDIDLSYHE